MIYGKICELNQYLGLHPNLDTAIHYVMDHHEELSFLQAGRTEVDGDKVFIACADYTTAPQKQLDFETHIVYADIHILRAGKECVGVAPADRLQEFAHREEQDYIGYRGEVRCLAKLDTDSFVLAMPGEPHMVHIMDGTPSPVRKAVIKVKIK